MRHALKFGTFPTAAVLAAAALAPAAQAQQEPSDLLVIRSAGLEAIAADPKDAGLVRAINMLIEHRVLELPAELEEDVPADAIQLGLQTLAGPWTLQAGLLPGAELDLDAFEDGPPPIYLQWTFESPDAEAAATLAGRFGAILAAEAPFRSQPVPDRPGMRMLEGAPLPIYHGVTEIGGRHGFTLVINAFAPGPPSSGALDLPEGVEPALAFAFDSRRLQPLLEAFAEQDGADAELVLGQLRAMGMLGPDAAVITAALGHGRNPGDPSHFTLRYTNSRSLMERTGLLADSMLTPADFGRVPADATYAQLSRINLRNILQSMRLMMPDGADFDDLMNQVEEHIGVHPQRDVLDHLGQLAGLYLSDTTGNGGLLSAAAFIEVTDADALGETIARITGTGNQMAQMFARGYIRFGEREVGGERLTTLMFPGLPVPLELSFALADGFLYAAATPQGLLAAMKYGRGGGRGLMANQHFRQGVGGIPSGAMQVTFCDTPRMLRPGYGIASLGAAALANAARSPSDRSRDPGLIMPSLAELLEGARGTASVVRFDGDDMVVTGSIDRSLLVVGTGVAGGLGGAQGIALPAMLAGVALPAVGKARSQARLMQSQSNLRQLHAALQMHAAEFDGRLPETTATLVEMGYIDAITLLSPFGPAADGGDDYFVNGSPATFDEVVYADKHVRAYDRALLAMEGRTVVLFADGHVQAMNEGAFRRMLEHSANQGVDFDLPWEQ